MQTNPSRAILPILLFLASVTPCLGQPSPVEPIPGVDSGAFFLYVEYYGSKYNRSAKRQEMVISALALPVNQLKKIPRLDNNGQYSSRNLKRYQKQQKIIRQLGGKKLTIRVNKKKINTFYPNGLKRGAIIEKTEYDQWNFIEKNIPPPPPPALEKGNYNLEWYWYETDPMNIKYMLRVIT